MAQTGAVSFDAGTFEVFGALLNGAALYPVKKETLLDAKQFAAFLREQRITTMWLTSPLLISLPKGCGYVWHTAPFNHRRRCPCPAYRQQSKTGIAGAFALERIRPDRKYDVFDEFSHRSSEYDGSIPIGKPIGNSTAYILWMKTQCLQPIGAPGELCVGGIGVARGYVNLPELTEKQFVGDPFRPGEENLPHG
jgi:surfactin family lipopeptide synthetase B